MYGAATARADADAVVCRKCRRVKVLAVLCRCCIVVLHVSPCPLRRFGLHITNACDREALQGRDIFGRAIDACNIDLGVQNAIPAPLNYKGFPKSICTSINHQVCHGIPSDRKLKEGDIINIDVTVIKDGYHGDTSRMYFVGEVSTLASRLCRVAKECMEVGINLVRPGIRLGDIGAAIQRHAEAHHFSIVREYCGHGIGIGFHEDPQVLHYGVPGTGVLLAKDMTFTIEPMLNAGKRFVKLLSDGWTVVTKDHSLSAQWEHTVLVTADGVEILTK